MYHMFFKECFYRKKEIFRVATGHYFFNSISRHLLKTKRFYIYFDTIYAISTQKTEARTECKISRLLQHCIYGDSVSLLANQFILHNHVTLIHHTLKISTLTPPPQKKKQRLSLAEF